ncbi:nitronate monooxygenase [Bradyrhizobium sp. USDA 4461]
MNEALTRAEKFAAAMGVRVPIFMAPMAGACPASLAIAVANAGGMGACGALLMKPDEISGWSREVRSNSNGAFQLNVWIPDPSPVRDEVNEARVREFLGKWGPAVPREAGDATPPDFESQLEAMLEVGPPVLSSIMGLYPAPFVEKMKKRGIKWFATASTVAEAKAAEAAGADVVVAQGSEAGGHRASFIAGDAMARQVGLFALLPAVVDAVRVPVVATGGISDARGVAAALLFGASAVQVGTGFLRSPEAKTHPAWADAIGKAAPEDTVVSRVFSGRAGRAIATKYVVAATGPDAPEPAPYPVQRGLTAVMRAEAGKANDVERMQAWAGQSAGLAKAIPAGEVVDELWKGAQSLLGG